MLPFCLTVQTILSEGGVPPRPVVFVSRPELVNRIREKLYQLQKDSGWVTVFGMAGSGKSVLAAEAVRHHSIIEGLFVCLEIYKLLDFFIFFIIESVYHLPSILYSSDPVCPHAECFPGGIHWLSIGQLDKPDLLIKIQSLCFRLEQSLDSHNLHRPPNSLDEAKERLRFLMLRRYPR